MGVTTATYCGPYIECKTRKTTTTWYKRMCRNPECSRCDQEVQHGAVRFCGECGHGIETVGTTVEVDAIDRLELEEEFDGSLCQFFFNPPTELEERGIHIWLVSEKKPRRDYYVDDGEKHVTELSPGDIADEVQEFTRKARKGLKKLETHYGPENVKVKWGVLHTIEG